MKSRIEKAKEDQAITNAIEARRDRVESEWYRKAHYGPGVTGWLIRKLRAFKRYRRKLRYAGAADSQST